MIKKLLIVILVLIALGLSIFFSIDFTKPKESETKDIATKINIKDKKLYVTYIGGNIINSSISYGNVINKEILIENKNNEDVIYALKFSDVSVSDNLLKYTMSYKIKEEETYQEISSGSLNGNANLGYNLICAPNSKMYLNIVIEGKNESEKTEIKGKLEIVSNLSSKAIFSSDFNDIHRKVLDKIDEKNGISESGSYILKIDNFVEGYKGYVLIDARDISELSFYYSVCDNILCLKNYKYTNKFQTSKLEKYDEEYINNLNEDSVCKAKNLKECKKFESLKYDESGGIKRFNDDSLALIDVVKEDFAKRNLNNNIYIYDVKKDIKNNYNIRGYILVDNRKKAEYYIYLTDDKYMISGYNITKLGNYSTTSNTIRQYRESAFNLSSENMSTVCSFTKLGECYNLLGEKV